MATSCPVVRHLARGWTGIRAPAALLASIMIAQGPKPAYLSAHSSEASSEEASWNKATTPTEASRDETFPAPSGANTAHSPHLVSRDEASPEEASPEEASPGDASPEEAPRDKATTPNEASWDETFPVPNAANTAHSPHLVSRDEASPEEAFPGDGDASPEEAPRDKATTPNEASWDETFPAPSGAKTAHSPHLVSWDEATLEEASGEKATTPKEATRDEAFPETSASTGLNPGGELWSRFLFDSRLRYPPIDSPYSPAKPCSPQCLLPRLTCSL